LTVKVITDSGSDISQQEAQELGITIVPLYLRFGDYRRLSTDPVPPSTSAPSAGDFALSYQEAARETDEIVSIHVTSKHSATYNAALLGKEVLREKKCLIEVVDSKGVTVWQGMTAIAAAKAARAWANLHEVMDVVDRTISQLRALALLDTLTYMVRGGRLSKAVSRVESVLNVKTMLTIRNGELRPAGIVRTRGKGISKLQEFFKKTLHAKDVSIAYSTTPDEAQTLAEHAKNIFPGIIPRIARLGPALGVHGGPGFLVAAVNQTDSA